MCKLYTVTNANSAVLLE